MIRWVAAMIMAGMDNWDWAICRPSDDSQLNRRGSEFRKECCN
ncbi:hypothetical protein AVDCRST_MAG92-3054 [uncultured Coleofasciculus sp.]|uniref:Uncharacterized protein n=1 Tax=uncultured Coleofasciculus sp. TaxID=1267456 RepID=A0A6J4JB97_9CYAN|nr:hypothetical protein AVDCRST_MAG92-3054 [uncultured Coleofasciculus sp.]